MSVSFLRLGAALAGAASFAFADSQITNVSVRSVAGSGSDTLIVGFSIAGTGQKAVLLRGIGPSLANFGVQGPVADPQLKLYDPSQTAIAQNEDWGGTAILASTFTSVGAFSLPANSKDAALYSRLGAGAYSVHLAANSGTGIALVEAYDAEPSSSTARLNNVSARSLAGTGPNVLTIGFAISGAERKTVLIRAVGPALTSYGVSGALPNPALKLFTGDSIQIGANDDWLYSAGWSAAFSAVGAFPLPRGSTDAALLVSLPPGTYTAQASGASGTTGTALIEVYEVTTAPAGSVVLQPVINVVPSTFAGTTMPSGGVRTNPQVISRPAPTYPFEYRVAGITGDALVDFLVGPDGLVIDAMVNHATDAKFGDASLAAVRRWVFLPGMINGVPATFHMQVPILFTLNDAAQAQQIRFITLAD